MDKQAARLAAEVSIERLAEQVGVRLGGRGHVRRGTCPFHVGEMKTPTLTVDRHSNNWTCPSCAPEGAGVIEFVALAEGISRQAATAHLRTGEPLTGAALHRRGGRGKGLVKHRTVRDLDAAFTVEDEDALLANVVSYYHRVLLETPAALEYLQGRGLTSEVIETFRIGFCDRSLGLRIPKANRAAGKEVRGRLHRIGVLRNTGHERFRGCLTFPVFDASGKVVQVYGRRLERARKGSVEHVDLHDDRRGLFAPGGFGSGKTVILTEGIVDALTFHVHGFTSVTCTFGVELTPDVRGALVEHEVQRVLIAFDRDDEGDAGASTVAEELVGLGVEVLRVVFPAGLDANDFTRQAEDPVESLARLLRHPEWMAGVRAINAPKTTAAPSSSPATVHDVTQPEGDDLIMQLGDLRWRVRGLSSNLAPGTMRLNVMVSREGVGFHVDVLDLYSSRHRGAFTRLASEELCIDEAEIKRDLSRILLAAELAQDELLRRQRETPVTAVPEMTEEDRAAALELLRNPTLLDRVTEDLNRCGLVGEHTNAIILYLAVVSRLLDDPLAVMVQSSSAAGKSSLMEAVLAFVPEEHRREFSSLTGQALFYIAPGGLRHRVLALAEEEGAKRASYSLKLLQSEGRITIASTSKDPVTGRLVAKEYVVEGPVALVMTTTSLDVDPELENRCVVLAVDESPGQTRAIHERQRQALSLDGLLARPERDRIRRLHQNAQRLLVPLHVVIPPELDVRFHGHGVRSRRDHRKLLGLVRATTLVHQYQREIHVHQDDQGHELRYLMATPEDVAIASAMFSEVHGNGLSEVPPHTRRVLDHLVKTTGSENDSVTLAEVAESLGLGRTRVWIHLRRLRELEYIVTERHHGQPVRFRIAPATTTPESDPVRPGASIHSPPDGPGSPPFAPRSQEGEMPNSEPQDAPGTPGGEERKLGRPKARTGKSAKSHRTRRSSVDRRRT